MAGERQSSETNSLCTGWLGFSSVDFLVTDNYLSIFNWSSFPVLVTVSVILIFFSSYIYSYN